jgi:hypothetical protein
MVESSRIATGFPNKIVTKLRYHDLLTLTSTAGSLAKYLFRWNSTFDPDFTGTGHQPLYRDTFAGIYDQYSVVSATAVIKFVNSTTTVYQVGCVTEDDSSSSTLITTLCEQNDGYNTILPPLSGALTTKTFNLSWDCKKKLGIDPYASETYKTANGANATEESFLVLWAAPIDSSTNSVYFEIDLVQTVLYTELQTPTGS